MDNEGNKQLWERLFAGIQSGKYQMPDSEPIHDHTYLPDGEVAWTPKLTVAPSWQICQPSTHIYLSFDIKE
ncbi:MAG: hypothetical protein P8179_24230 [Candidatus Thiodiazotropha sp.]